MVPFRVVAIIAAFNESDIISSVIENLADNGIDSYLIDNLSTDDTVTEAARWLDRGLLGIERFPDGIAADVDGASLPMDWGAILARKEKLAQELDADWFIHHDADEFREAPWPGCGLRDAIEWVDRLGYNAVRFRLLDFQPTSLRLEPGTDIKQRFRYFTESADYNQLQTKCWKKQSLPVDLVRSGGHDVQFDERRVFPINFLLRHYPIRSQEHGTRKVFSERKNRFLEVERDRGWHVQYDAITDPSHSFVHDPAEAFVFTELVRLDTLLDNEVLAAVRTEADKQAGVLERTSEALRFSDLDLWCTSSALAETERAFATIRSEHSRAELEQIRTAVELHETQQELKRRREQIEELTVRLRDAGMDLSSLQRAVDELSHAFENALSRETATRGELEALTGSYSWRVTAPLRLSREYGRRLALRVSRTLSRHWAKGKQLRSALTSAIRPSAVLDVPADNERAYGGSVYVAGWAIPKRTGVISVDVFFDDTYIAALPHGHARPDVPGVLGPIAPLACGFGGTIRLPAEAESGNLRVRVKDSKGGYQDFVRQLQVITDPRVSSKSAPRAASITDVDAGLARARQALTEDATRHLDAFLATSARLGFPAVDHPEITIILVLHNRAELTLQCLLSLRCSSYSQFEIILIDNGSTDATAQLLTQIDGVRAIRNVTNVQFVRACNQSAALGRGPLLLFLNNDTQLLPNALAAAVTAIRPTDVGAVGGRIILPDGSLQEAGSTIWRDGSCTGYGRGSTPDSPEFMFRRDVDYCSGVFLLTRRDLFLAGGGFNEVFAPAYYEETDYCASLWKDGYRVVYEPRSTVFHFEFASSSSQEAAVSLQRRNQTIFVDRNREWLKHQPEPHGNLTLLARQRFQPQALRILIVDDRPPHVDMGSGFPRTNRLIEELIQSGHAVTLYPTDARHESWSRVYSDIPQDVEVMLGHGPAGLEAFLCQRAGYYNVIWVSRPHNLMMVKAILDGSPEIRGSAALVYDAEAIFARREILRARLESGHSDATSEEMLIDHEVDLGRVADVIVAVSTQEAVEFSRRGLSRVYILGHAIAPSATPESFGDRSGLLFVGAIVSDDAPNADSMRWFTRDVLPVLRGQDHELELSIAGPVTEAMATTLRNEGVHILGQLPAVTGLFERHRVFVAPTRYAAGIPHKVHNAAAHGVPIVTTSVIANQLGWKDGVDLLVADDAQMFAAACLKLYRDADLWHHIRANALQRVERDCDPVRFREQLDAILRTATLHVRATSVDGQPAVRDSGALERRNQA